MKFLFVIIVILAIRVDVSAQQTEPVYLLFDSTSILQTKQDSYCKYYKDIVLCAIYFDYKSEKAGTYFHFVHNRTVLYEYQKKDTTFYAYRNFFEGKKCYDGNWFKQAYNEEGYFLGEKNVLIYLIDIRDEKDGKVRVYQVSYEPLATM